MATGGDTAITTQPRSKRKELEQFVRDLDPVQVVGKWTVKARGHFMLYIVGLSTRHAAAFLDHGLGTSHSLPDRHLFQLILVTFIWLKQHSSISEALAN